MTSAPALPAELTIYTVAEFVPRCRAWVEEPMPADPSAGASCDALVVDAAAVQDIDAAGVQLLLSLARSLRRRERALRLAAPSPALAAACSTLGAASLLAGPQSAESAS